MFWDRIRGTNTSVGTLRPTGRDRPTGRNGRASISDSLRLTVAHVSGQSVIDVPGSYLRPLYSMKLEPLTETGQRGLRARAWPRRSK